MDNEKSTSFKLLMLICLITIAVELALSFWSSIRIASLDLNSSNIESIRLAGKGVMTFFMLLLGSWITMVLSIFIPERKVWELHNKCSEPPYYWLATIFLFLYFVIPAGNTIASIFGGFSLIKSAGFSVFEMILSLL